MILNLDDERARQRLGLAECGLDGIAYAGTYSATQPREGWADVTSDAHKPWPFNLTLLPLLAEDAIDGVLLDAPRYFLNQAAADRCSPRPLWHGAKGHCVSGEVNLKS